MRVRIRVILRSVEATKGRALEVSSVANAERLKFVVPNYLYRQVQDESDAFGELRIDGDVAVHLLGHLAADGESEAVALREVMNLQERFEDVLALLLGDATACV